MRGVYRGFYDGDDDAFVAHLRRLGLDGAADLFRAHIGAGDPHAHTFDRGAFVTSFGAIFDHCKEAGVRLHPDFVLLGAYLGGLYDSLAELDVPLDVVSAFRAGSSRAVRRMSLPRRRVAIAGATGFVGQALAAALLPSWDVVGITRREKVRRSAEEAHLDESSGGRLISSRSWSASSRFGGARMRSISCTR